MVSLFFAHNIVDILLQSFVLLGDKCIRLNLKLAHLIFHINQNTLIYILGISYVFIVTDFFVMILVFGFYFSTALNLIIFLLVIFLHVRAYVLFKENEFSWIYLLVFRQTFDRRKLLAVEFILGVDVEVHKLSHSDFIDAIVSIECVFEKLFDAINF